MPLCVRSAFRRTALGVLGVALTLTLRTSAAAAAEPLTLDSRWGLFIDRIKTGSGC